MELRVLEYYLMVAREENITKAAEILHITQPTLSRQLIALEEELGVTLFKRGKHRIYLTEDGMYLKRRAQEMVGLAEKTKRDFRREDGELIGEISIGGSETQSMHFLARLMTDFYRKYPMVKFDLYSSSADNIKDRIEKGLIDIGLLTEPVDVGKYGYIRIPRKERWGILVRKDSRLASLTSVTPQDLLDVPLLMVKRERVKNELANWFGDYFEQMNIVSTYNLLFNAAIMAENINGAAICFYFSQTYENLLFVPLKPALETGSVLVWKKNQFFSPAAVQFIQYMRNSDLLFPKYGQPQKEEEGI